MDLHPTPFPVSKAQSVKSKYKKVSEAPKQKIKDAPVQRHRRTFGTIRNPNVPVKTVTEKPKAQVSNQISVKQTKTEPEIAPAPKPESAKKSPENESNNSAKPRKKKSVSFPEKLDGSVTKNSPARKVERVQTPVRPPFSAKPVRTSGTPYLSAEKCSSCRFDRLETASYWLGQIKSAESVGKHFVSVEFFRLADDCKAEPARNLRTELKNYLARHAYLCIDTKWKDVSCRYGILKKENSSVNLFSEETITQGDSKLGNINDEQEQTTKHDDDQVKEIYEQER